MFAGGFSVIACLSTGWPGTAAWVNGLQVSVGMLLLSVTAATSLAEERVRGSLDVLMSTSLSTRDIVLGKWLGTFRQVPLLAVLPTVVLMYNATSDRLIPSIVVTILYILCSGAAVTSVGLAFATWCSRLGRAVALTITLYVFVAVGWLFLGILLGGPGPQNESVMMFSTFFGPGEIAFEAGANVPGANTSRWTEHLVWGVFWSIVHAGGAAVFLVATLLTFNRYLGRVEAGSRFHEPEPVLTPVRVKKDVEEELPVA